MEDVVHSFSENNFMPHGHCYFWEPYILWSHAISDAIIAIAYCVIPLTLIYIFRKRNDFKFIWMMILFAVFIFGCGITHVFDVITIWNPVYRLDSVARIITALASIGTAIVLVRVTPKILLIPTAEQWKKVNVALQRQVEQIKEKDKVIEAFKEFEYLTETLPQLVWTTKPDGKASFYNQQWYQYTGLSFEPVFEDVLTKIIQPDMAAAAHAGWQQALTTGNTFETELCVRRNDGIYRWFSARISPAKAEGAIILWVGTLTDIHDQKMQTNVLEEKNRQLAIINNDLDNFIYTASHDLRAPISNIEGLTNLLTKKSSEKLDTTERKLLDLINTSTFKLKQTIDDLTEITKVQKELNATIEPVSFSEVLNEIKSDIIEEITTSDAAIYTSFEVNNINFAKRNLRSILYNLLTNAIKYRSPDRALEVHISTHYENKNIILSVADNGLGIDPKQIHKLFIMFTRLHTHVEGTGIGLYIIKRIVENSGGKIEVESTAGKGTTFHVYLKDIN